MLHYDFKSLMERISEIEPLNFERELNNPVVNVLEALDSQKRLNVYLDSLTAKPWYAFLLSGLQDVVSNFSALSGPRPQSAPWSNSTAPCKPTFGARVVEMVKFINWNVVSDQVHNIMIAVGALLGSTGFGLVPDPMVGNIIGTAGTVIALLGSVLSSFNLVNAQKVAVAAPPSSASGPVQHPPGTVLGPPNLANNQNA
ncbi:MAG: hypothetical protein WBX25_24135 [Rhodomicrobium sp.]